MMKTLFDGKKPINKINTLFDGKGPSNGKNLKDFWYTDRDILKLVGEFNGDWN